MRLVIGAVVLCAAGAAALAQGTRGSDRGASSEPEPVPMVEACGVEDEIIALSYDILNERAGLGTFRSPSFGSHATYYLLRYNDWTLKRALEQFRRTGEATRRPPRFLDDMRVAYLISNLGVDEGFARAGVDPLATLAEGNMHVVRAMLLSAGGARFFELLAKVRADPELNAALNRVPWLLNVPQLVMLDQPEAVRIALAERALAAGETVMAARLLATLEDLERYYALVEAQDPEDRRFQQLASPNSVTQFGLVQLNHAEPIPGASMSLPLYQVFRAGILGRQLDILNITLNQTGRERELQRVALTYLTALERGEVQPKWDAEVAWALQYDAMRAFMGDEDTQFALTVFDTSTENRHFAGRAQQLMDWVVAKRAVRPFLEGGAAPGRPEGLSDAFDWVLWVATAEAVRGGEVSFEGAAQQMAAELYAMQDAFEPMRAVARDMELDARLALYRDVARRLDRRCLGASDHPGQALLLGGAILYKF